MNIEASSRRRPYAALCVLQLVSGLSGCAVITGLNLSPESSISCSSDRHICGLDPDFVSTFIVSGTGRSVCDSIVLATGDGTRTSSGAHDFGPTGNRPWVGKHLYGPTAWPGIKTVRATGTGTCFGDARLGVRVMERVEDSDKAGQFTFLDHLTVAFAQPPLPLGNNDPCAPVPQKGPLRPGDVVTVDSSADQKFEIDYGCAFGGCVYNADGEPGTSAPNDFAFPGLKKYSLVFRVGNQLTQGGGFTRFRVSAGGPLEICLNDTRGAMTDNVGGLRLSITVDQTLP